MHHKMPYANMDAGECAKIKQNIYNRVQKLMDPIYHAYIGKYWQE